MPGERALTWNEGGGDDDVHLFALLGEQRHLGVDELLGHLLGVAADAVAGLLDVHLQRLRPEGLELLQSRWSATESTAVTFQVSRARVTAVAAARR